MGSSDMEITTSIEGYNDIDFINHMIGHFAEKYDWTEIIENEDRVKTEIADDISTQDLSNAEVLLMAARLIEGSDYAFLARALIWCVLENTFGSDRRYPQTEQGKGI